MIFLPKLFNISYNRVKKLMQRRTCKNSFNYACKCYIATCRVKTLQTKKRWISTSLHDMCNYLISCFCSTWLFWFLFIFYKIVARCCHFFFILWCSSSLWTRAWRNAIISSTIFYTFVGSSMKSSLCELFRMMWIIECQIFSSRILLFLLRRCYSFHSVQILYIASCNTKCIRSL